MKLIEKMACCMGDAKGYEFSANEDQYRGFIAGFRAAREMAANLIDPKCATGDFCELREWILEIGQVVAVRVPAGVGEEEV